MKGVKKKRAIALENVIRPVLASAYEDDPNLYVLFEDITLLIGHYCITNNLRLRKGVVLDADTVKAAMTRADKKMRESKTNPEAIAPLYPNKTTQKITGYMLARTRAERESIKRKLEIRDSMIEGLQKGSKKTLEIAIEKKVLKQKDANKFLEGHEQTQIN